MLSMDFISTVLPFHNSPLSLETGCEYILPETMSSNLIFYVGLLRS